MKDASMRRVEAHRRIAPTAQAAPSVLQRLARAEDDAMQACMDEYGGLVRSLARRYLPNSDVDDAVQEVLIALWRCADRFDPSRGSELAFVATLAQRKLIDYRRRINARTRVLHRSCAAKAPGETAPVRDAGHSREITCRAVAALRELPPEVQDTLTLSIYRGLTYRSIAEAIGAPNGTVKSWASRGLQRLREKLETIPLTPAQQLADVA
jgi:RNA polymerase sigma-70 factor (ECF subfamily)